MTEMGLDDDDLDFLEITDTKERATLSGKAAPAAKPAAAKPTVTPEETAVRKWLSAKGLGHLTQTFMEKEYTDVGVMTEMGLDDDDLDFLEITDAKEREMLSGKAAPAPAAKPTVTPEETAVRKWLSAKSLGHLTQSFMEKEYTDVSVMTEMGLDDDDLDYLETTDAKERATLSGKAAPAPAPATKP